MAVAALPHAVSGELREHHGASGRLAYYVAGEGPPMLLLHSINAAASAIEIKPIFERMRSQYRVYAPDLPGYGHSDRSKRPYTVELFTAAVHDMMEVIGDAQPIHGVGLSLSSEFLVRAALADQSRFASLTLITPTGLNRISDSLRTPGSREIPGVSAIVGFPLWRGALFRGLTSKGSIRYFLKRTYGGPNVDEEMVEYDYISTNQEGASNAPYAFLSGRLFSRDIRLLYEQLTVPVWVPHATRGDFKDFSGAEWTSERDNWRVQPFESGALVHYERPEEYFSEFERFLSQAA